MAKKGSKKQKAPQTRQTSKPLRATTAAVVSEKQTAPAAKATGRKKTPAAARTPKLTAKQTQVPSSARTPTRTPARTPTPKPDAITPVIAAPTSAPAPAVETKKCTSLTVVSERNTPRPPVNEASDDANALFILGVRYATGRDVEQDMVTAHKWLNLAATLGHDEAKTWRADIASEMTKAQIAEAQKQARAWLQTREAKRPRETEAAPAPLAVKRPIYVRRAAQAMRSAHSFARVCACA